MISYLFRSSIFGIVALLAFTFIPAGTFHYWQGWAYVVTWIIVGSTYTVYVATHDPALLKRRTEAGISHEKEPTQKVIIVFLWAVKRARSAELRLDEIRECGLAPPRILNVWVRVQPTGDLIA